MIGDLISAGSKIFEGFMNRQATKENNERLQQNAVLDRRLQQDFAQHGISWKVQDALDAGVHPLAALGASSASYSPVSVGTSAATFSGLGDGGADIGRAVNATMTKSDKQTAAGKAAEALALERGTLENELLRTQIASQTAKLNQAGGNPSMPNPGERSLLDGQGSTVNLPIPEAKKSKDRPGLFLHGKRVLTNPLTSNAEEYEDRYGDEGLGSAIPQAGILGSDFVHNVNNGNLTREGFVQWAKDALHWIDRKTDMGFGRYGPKSGRR